jgi:hypothetical protein
VVSFTPQPLYHKGRSPRYLLVGRLSGPGLGAMAPQGEPILVHDLTSALHEGTKVEIFSAEF